MNRQKILECEARRLQSFQLLPHSFKKTGIAILALSLISMILAAFLPDSFAWLMLLSKKAILAALLVIAVSKDKIEDEMTVKLRAQSFTFAFVVGVIYALVQPYINYIVAYFIKPDKASFADLDVLVFLWFMLMIQLCFFYVLKKAR